MQFAVAGSGEISFLTVDVNYGMMPLPCTHVSRLVEEGRGWLVVPTVARNTPEVIAHRVRRGLWPIGSAGVGLRAAC